MTSSTCPRNSRANSGPDVKSRGGIVAKITKRTGRLANFVRLSLDVEILRLRVMHDQRIGALFGHQHIVFAEAHANLIRLQELCEQPAVFQIRARRISEAVTA